MKELVLRIVAALFIAGLLVLVLAWYLDVIPQDDDMGIVDVGSQRAG